MKKISLLWGTLIYIFAFSACGASDLSSSSIEITTSLIESSSVSPISSDSSNSETPSTFSESEGLPYITLTNLTGTIEPTEVQVGDSFLGLTVKSLENKGVNYKMSFSMEGTLEVVGIYNKEDGAVWTIQLDAPSMEKYPQIYEIQEIRSQWAEHEGENPTAFNSKIYFYGDEAEMTDPLIQEKRIYLH